MEYLYTDITNKPKLATETNGIEQDVASSSMSDKTLEWCRWDQATSELRILFTNTLSAEDKAILDTIVSNNS